MEPCPNCLAPITRLTEGAAAGEIPVHHLRGYPAGFFCAASMYRDFVAPPFMGAPITGSLPNSTKAQYAVRILPASTWAAGTDPHPPLSDDSTWRIAVDRPGFFHSNALIEYRSDGTGSGCFIATSGVGLKRAMTRSVGVAHDEKAFRAGLEEVLAWCWECEVDDRERVPEALDEAEDDGIFARDERGELNAEQEALDVAQARSQTLRGRAEHALEDERFFCLDYPADDCESMVHQVMAEFSVGQYAAAKAQRHPGGTAGAAARAQRAAECMAALTRRLVGDLTPEEQAVLRMRHPGGV